MIKKLLAELIIWLFLFNGIVRAENEAIYNLNTRILHIPKVAVDANYYAADFQQGEGLSFLLTSVVPSVSSSSSNIATYNSVTHSLIIPTVIVGSDNYTVNMQQGEGFNFAVTNTILVDSYFKPIDVFDLNSHRAGGNRSVDSTISNITKGSGNGCGYSYPRTRVESDQLMQQSGGSTTLSTFTEWCGAATGQTACIKGFGKLLVDDELLSVEVRTIRLNMMELMPGHWTVIEFNSLEFNPFGKNGPMTNVSAVRSDAIVGPSVVCDRSVQPTQIKEAINGSWVGYKATYSPDTMVGSTATATVSCASQICIINSSSGATSVNLSSFDFTGVWATAFGAPKLAGALMTGDHQLLSMFVCNSPLDEAKTFENCSFFTFKR